MQEQQRTTQNNKVKNNKDVQKSSWNLANLPARHAEMGLSGSIDRSMCMFILKGSVPAKLGKPHGSSLHVSLKAVICTGISVLTRKT
jgi:hypothetical protein